MLQPDSPDPGALLRMVPPDLWGLWTRGKFSTAADHGAAARWVRLVLEEYPSSYKVAEELDLTDGERQMLLGYKVGRYSFDHMKLPIRVVRLRKRLGEVARHPPLRPAHIPGSEPHHIRARVRWAALHYYDYALGTLAEEMKVSRSYLSHYLLDEHRNLTDTLLSGLVRAGFHADWITNGEGEPRKSSL